MSSETKENKEGGVVMTTGSQGGVVMTTGSQAGVVMTTGSQGGVVMTTEYCWMMGRGGNNVGTIAEQGQQQL